MTNQPSEIKVAYVSPFVPRQCGIATYTKSLVESTPVLARQDILAIDNSPGRLKYPKNVQITISDYDRASFQKAAAFLNESRYDVVHLQHEYGLYGGKDGSNILDLVRLVKKPLITTFHTVLSNPEKFKVDLISEITNKSRKVIVMAKEAVNRLESIYGMDRRKIVQIHHGVPDMAFPNTDQTKWMYGLTKNKIIAVFGLISRNKGIEYAIHAMVNVIKEFPEAILFVIGKTHPMIIMHEGESYRQELMQLVKRLGLTKNVFFINKYLTDNEIKDYLNIMDIYISPYLEPEQITSGTLAYAIGSGKVAISTPYAYAVELLKNNRGFLVPFRDGSAIAEKIVELLKNPRKYAAMAMRSYSYGRKMIWSNVGLKHEILYKEVGSEL